jgi:hypothetical protein
MTVKFFNRSLVQQAVHRPQISQTTLALRERIAKPTKALEWGAQRQCLLVLVLACVRFPFAGFIQ